MLSLSLLLICSLLAGRQPAHCQIIGGQGNFRFQYVPEKLVLPEGAHVMDAHGLGVDADHNIYLTYAPDPASSDTHGFVRWAPDGSNGTVLGPGVALSAGTPHGLRFAQESSGDFMYHANKDRALHKTTLDGTIVWSRYGPPATNESRFLPNKPTWIAAPPGSRYLYVADGYGSNYIHVYTTDGEYTGKSYGGPGTALGKFRTCHSINYDPRVNKLIVTDRENHRHQYFDFDPGSPNVFEFSSAFQIPQLQRPCGIRMDFGNGHAIVPALGGPVGILDGENQLVSVIRVSVLLGASGHLHPHDATFLPNGDIVVATWNPGRISYWRRLPRKHGERPRMDDKAEL
mmetsp:Transcript_101470/g.326093  ORF Transcript_101470/g.326093 Transcript_101470/m.326093 type:complete len:344 (-) Transcript_101470:23-1054(-)